MSKKIKILVFFLILIIIIALLYLYAMFFGAKGLVVKEYKIANKSIINEYNGLKIVHLSDIHYGISTTKKDLENIVKYINKIKPDLVFLTGDLVDNKIDSKQHKEIASTLSQITSELGKYAINGNHDTMYKKWDELIEESDFINLNDAYDTVYKNSTKFMFIAGISDNIYSTKKIKDKSEAIFQYLNSNEINNSIFNILLIHEPDYIEDIDYSKFNLILSGHSHNGQVSIPFIGALYTPKGSRKYYKEYYKLNNTDLYISSGIGTTFLPIRLFNKPSINFYRIVQN